MTFTKNKKNLDDFRFLPPQHYDYNCPASLSPISCHAIETKKLVCKKIISFIYLVVPKNSKKNYIFLCEKTKRNQNLLVN